MGMMALVLLGFFIGSIPTGYWFAKYFFNLDITQRGSGNIGATNVARILGNKYFLLVFALDMGKAFCYLLFIEHYAHLISFPQITFLYIIAGMLLLGNAYSPFINFKGGKGVATVIGILAACAPLNVLIVFIVAWLVSIVILRTSGIPAIIAIFMTTLFVSRNHSAIPGLSLFMIFLTLWLLIRHHENIRLFFRCMRNELLP